MALAPFSIGVGLAQVAVVDVTNQSVFVIAGVFPFCIKDEPKHARVGACALPSAAA